MAFSTLHPFTREQAVAAHLTDAMLRGRTKYQRLFRGIYISAKVEVTLLVQIHAALLVTPPGTIISHVTALRWYGYDLGPILPIHTSTRIDQRLRIKGIRLHRREAHIPSRLHRGIEVTGPERTLTDLAYDVQIPELIQAIEWMMHRGFTTLDRLTTYMLEQHLRGVRRLREVMSFVREGSESPMETRVRLMIRFAHLPEPQPNVVIRDEHGHFLARGDLVYARWRILVEYDGWQHERNAVQRQRDIGRRERLEAAGWRVIVVTVADLSRPTGIVSRVHHALTERGYTGPGPVFSIIWDRWFPNTSETS